MTNDKLAATAILKVNVNEAPKATISNNSYYKETKSIPSPKATTFSSVKAAKKAFTLTWKKVTAKVKNTRIKGYQIQYSTNKKFKKAKTKTVNGYKKNKITIKKLKSKKKYYVRIRTVLKINGKTSYSKWSKVKTVKTK